MCVISCSITFLLFVTIWFCVIYHEQYPEVLTCLNLFLLLYLSYNYHVVLINSNYSTSCHLIKSQKIWIFRYKHWKCTATNRFTCNSKNSTRNFVIYFLSLDVWRGVKDFCITCFWKFGKFCWYIYLYHSFVWLYEILPIFVSFWNFLLFPSRNNFCRRQRYHISSFSLT